MIIVSDSGPLISLSKIKKFNILNQIFKQIIIPDAVYNEVVKDGRKRAGESETKDALGTENIENTLTPRTIMKR
ncbi:MAG: hypothetical protein AB1765_03135 [Candidatus Hydrogenedentota bacterium]